MAASIWVCFIWICSFPYFVISNFANCGTDGEKLQSGNTYNESSLRLPPSVIPVHYVVKLRPLLEKDFIIEGHVEITFNVTQKTDKIILHIKGIVTHNDSAKVISISDPKTSFFISNHTYDPRREFYIVHLKDHLPANQKFVIKLDFTATLSDDLEGFYKTSYNDNDGNKVWVAATQFQPTSARRAFPCFDEPQFKATFKVFLSRRTNMTAISNMPLLETKPMEGVTEWVTDEFETSVPMSTYLLAFVVSDFKFIEGHSKSLNSNIKVWSKESLINEADFGKNISVEGLVFLEEFFHLKFSLPKLDLVAVPEMSPNAMENWGLIISRESGLLYDIKRRSDVHMKWVAYLISHELAHQWFGNIVTMKWWTDLWLNEGFATYIGHRVVDHIRPEYKVLDEFIVNTLHKVMKVDALKTAPPVRVLVEDPQRIREVFGEIAYSKGASIIRMMNFFLGEEALRDGLSIYLNDLKYQSSEQDDLWCYLTNAARKTGVLPEHLNVKHIMDTWTSQPGFPVISVIRDQNGITLKQSPYYLIKQTNNSEPDSRKWNIPISWVMEDSPDFENTKPRIWFSKNKSEMKLDNVVPSKEKWIFFNPQHSGYYRVNYDNEAWHQLINQLRKDHQIIHVISRAQLIDDSMALARAGYLDYSTAMSVTSYIKNETEYIPWTAALNNFAYLDKMLRATSLYGAFKKYVLSVISPLYNSLGTNDKDNDTMPERALRKIIIDWSCYLEHEDCVQTGIQLINKWIENSSKLSSLSMNFAKVFCCASVREGGEDIWQFMWDRYHDKNQSVQHKSVLFHSLGCSKNVWILARFLEASFRQDWGISRQDAALVYRIVSKSSIGSLLTWNHLKENWIKVRDYIGTSMFALPGLVKSVTRHFNTRQYMEEIKGFKEKYEGKLGPAKWSIDQAIESAEANVFWMESNLETIELWLRQKGFDSSLK